MAFMTPAEVMARVFLPDDHILVFSDGLQICRVLHQSPAGANVVIDSPLHTGLHVERFNIIGLASDGRKPIQLLCCNVCEQPSGCKRCDCDPIESGTEWISYLNPNKVRLCRERDCMLCVALKAERKAQEARMKAELLAADWETDGVRWGPKSERARPGLHLRDAWYDMRRARHRAEREETERQRAVTTVDLWALLRLRRNKRTGKP